MNTIMEWMLIGYGSAGLLALVFQLIHEWRTKEEYISRWIHYPVLFLFWWLFLYEFINNKIDDYYREEWSSGWQIALLKNQVEGLKIKHDLTKK